MLQAADGSKHSLLLNTCRADDASEIGQPEASEASIDEEESHIPVPSPFAATAGVEQDEPASLGLPEGRPRARGGVSPPLSEIAEPKGKYPLLQKVEDNLPKELESCVSPHKQDITTPAGIVSCYGLLQLQPMTNLTPALRAL